MQFNDTVVRLMAETYADLPVNRSSSERVNGLLHCLSKLSDKQRRLLRLRYADSLSIRDLADQERKSEAAVVMVLARLRKLLYSCINSTVAGGAG